jgi:1-acyl-sn-glycerol-3-phosphate acyltransferase
VSEIVKRVASGTSVVLFAEGTSSDGNRVLPFRSALLGAIEDRGDGGSILMQPMAITYIGQHGLPMGRQHRPLVAWYGDLDFMPHIRAFIERGAVDALVTYGDPVPADRDTDRKAMGKRMEGTVRELLVTALRGRPMPMESAP